MNKIPIILCVAVFFSCTNTEYSKYSKKSIKVPICTDFVHNSTANTNFSNLLYLVDEYIDTSMLKSVEYDFTIRIIYNVASGNSYILKLYEKGSDAILKIKTFKNGELSFFNYCMKRNLEYNCNSIIVRKEKIDELKSKLLALSGMYDFDKPKLNPISFEIVSNNNYRYGVAVNNEDIIREEIEKIMLELPLMKGD